MAKQGRTHRPSSHGPPDNGLPNSAADRERELAARRRHLDDQLRVISERIARSANEATEMGAKIEDVSSRLKKGVPPPKLITAAVAVKRYDVSRVTLRRAVRDRRLTDHRAAGCMPNAQLILDEDEVAARWPTRKTRA
jgi:hypothetical protein